MRYLQSVLALAIPGLFATVVVLYAFVIAAVPLELLWRPLFAATAVSLALALGLAAVARDPFKGGMWATIVVATLLGQLVLAVVFVILATLLGHRTIAGHPGSRAAVLVAGGASTLLLASILFLGHASNAFNTDPVPVPRLTADVRGADGPNFYLLLLDGYPREDTLRSEFGIDNGPFLTGLEERGFDVYEDSHSNYDQTPFTLISMLSLRHLVEIDALGDAPSEVVQRSRLTSRALRDPPLLELLSKSGYRTRVLASPIVHAQVHGADEIWSSGQPTDFELNLLQRTPLASVTDQAGLEPRLLAAGVTSTLNEFAGNVNRPTFTLAHVMAPHAPFVFGHDGSVADAPPCYPASCGIFDGYYTELGWAPGEYRDHLANQLETLNRLVLVAVDSIQEQDPQAVIIVFSDHGLRFDRANHDERFRNLLTASTPGHADLFGEAPTLINVVPELMNAYLHAGLPRLPDTLYDPADVSRVDPSTGS